MLNVDGKQAPQGGYITDVLTNYAVDWLAQPRTSPFVLYLSHKAVHEPFEPAIRHSELFSDAEIPVPRSMSDDRKGKPEWLRNLNGGRQYGEPYKRFVRKYDRCIVGVDDSVGRVLAQLERMGAMDNTVIVFASDNGFFLGEHGMGDKRAMYEESIRIPLLIRYPRLIKPGTLIEQMALNIDVCPTLLDLAGVPQLEATQGKSLRPLLRGRTSDWRSEFFYGYVEEKPFKIPTIRGVRTTRWKYIEYPEINDIAELYDLKKDPYELHNLINDPASASTVKDMRSRLGRLMKETGYKRATETTAGHRGSRAACRRSATTMGPPT
jgi:N-acetylglucosamine-6-sulfatase